MVIIPQSPYKMIEKQRICG